MENGPFIGVIGDFPIKTSIKRGFSIAMFDYPRVNVFFVDSHWSSLPRFKNWMPRWAGDLDSELVQKLRQRRQVPWPLKLNLASKVLVLQNCCKFCT